MSLWWFVWIFLHMMVSPPQYVNVYELYAQSSPPSHKKSSVNDYSPSESECERERESEKDQRTGKTDQRQNFKHQRKCSLPPGMNGP